MNCASKRADAVLTGVKQCYLFVLCKAKWTVSMISWEVTILESCGCVLS